jgi:hypothetical protein
VGAPGGDLGQLGQLSGVAIDVLGQNDPPSPAAARPPPELEDGVVACGPYLGRVAFVEDAVIVNRLAP